MHLNKLTTQRGFTLLEMVIVMGIIGVLAGGVISLMGTFGEGAKIQRAETDMDGITTALRQYEILGKTFPSTQQGLDAMVTKPSNAPIPKRWTQTWKEAPKDPWQNDYIYENNSGSIKLYSKGPDGIDKTEDDIVSDK